MLCHFNRVVCAQSIQWKLSADGQHVNCEKKTATWNHDDGMKAEQQKKPQVIASYYIHMGDVIRIEFRPKTNCRKSYKTWSMAHSHIRTSHTLDAWTKIERENEKKTKKKRCKKKQKQTTNNKKMCEQ